MPDRPNLTYRYDGTFEGLLCCVFESYYKKELPLDILAPDAPPTLFPAREIETDTEKARRVLVSIPRKMGAAAPGFLRRAFLTCLPHKELRTLEFLRLGYRVGPTVLNLLTDDTVHELTAAVRFLEREAHFFKEFIRFSDFRSALVSEIKPKNLVLPLLLTHFCERFPEEQFLIHDRVHGMALIYHPHHAEIVPIESLDLPEPDETERKYRELWRMFYKTIEIEGRHNPRCRMGHMPKRYWDCMTEFQQRDAAPKDPASRTGKKSGLSLPG